MPAGTALSGGVSAVRIVGVDPRPCTAGEALNLLDACVEIPMTGTGAGLNAAVAASLALYKLAGLV